MNPALLLLVALSPATPPDPGAAPAPAPASAGPSLHVAALVESLVHPGLLVGGELPLLEGDALRVFVTLEGGGYLHPQSHRALFATVEGGYRLSLPAGLDVEALLGAGGIHTWLDGEVYLQRRGHVVRSADIGRPGLALAAALGFGWRSDDGPLRAFCRTRLLGQYPFDGALLPRVVIEAGLSFQLPNGENP